MTDWILRHMSGMLDWLLVFLFIYALVFVIQFMVNFFSGPEGRQK